MFLSPRPWQPVLWESDMASSAAGWINRLLDSRLARRIADAGLTCYARRRVAELDRLNLIAGQHATLRALVRRAVGTQFGHDHGFHEIRSVEDYQRRVP